jgi:glycosyltransferase involved in cell wall biosynthesis
MVRNVSGHHVPRVSIGIPVFNGARYIAEAVHSHLNQTFEDFELIVSDNASEDETPEILEEIAKKDSRVRLLRNDVNLGANRNYNITLAASQGEYFRWHAHDDVLEPTFLERCVDRLDADPGVVLAYTRSILVDGKGRPFLPYGDVWLSEEGAVHREPEDPKFIRYASSKLAHERFRAAAFHFRAGAAFFGLIRRTAFKHSTLQQPFYGTDRVVFVELALAGRFALVEEPLFLHRWHDEASRVMNNERDRAKWADPNHTPRWYPSLIFFSYLSAINRAEISPYERTMAKLYLVRKALRHEELRRLVSVDTISHFSSLARRAFGQRG